MKNSKYKFTTFTSLYNRKHTIHRVWDSLNSQTYKDFEWIVVDDGSTDNIIPLLKEYKRNAFFPVTILVQENKGKHFAWNRAVEIAQGELWIPADSDDVFVPDTLEKFSYYWDQIPKDERNKYSGVNCLCIDPETNKIMGEEFPNVPLISNNLELVYKYKIQGHKWGCIRTDVLREFQFPMDFKGTHYPEGYLWLSIARRYQNISVNEPLLYYYQDSGNSITGDLRDNLKKNAPIRFNYYAWDLNTNLDYKFKYGCFLSLLKSYAIFWRLGFFLNHRFSDMLYKMKGWSKFFAILTLLPSSVIYFFTYRKLKKRDDTLDTRGDQ